MVCYIFRMKKFFNIKQIIYLSIACVTLLTLILLLIFPIGIYANSVTVYDTYWNKVLTKDYPYDSPRDYQLTPFTLSGAYYSNGMSPRILLAQTIVFTVVGIVFLVFLVLFLIELIKSGAFKRKSRPSKIQQLEARIAELEKQAKVNSEERE